MPPSATRAHARPGAAHAGRGARAWWTAAGLAAAGTGISAYLTVSAARGVPPVCVGSACAEVAASPFARLLGVPTAAWGLALYLVAGITAVAGARRPESRSTLATVLFGLAAFGAVFSAYLLWLQVAVLRAVCVWCAASDVLWALLLILALRIARSPG